MTLIPWVVAFTLLTADGSTIKVWDKAEYRTQAQCNAMKAIRLSRVLDVLPKLRLEFLRATCELKLS